MLNYPFLYVSFIKKVSLEEWQMAGIIVRKGSQTLLQTAIEAGEYIIGRDRTCDFCLEDEEVSHKHAKIILSENGVEIADLASLNGTFMNGKKITTASLTPGDIINVSGYSIILTDNLLPETLDKSNNSPHKKDKLTIGSLTDNNVKSPKVTRVHDGFTIGRCPESDMCLANENISWTHATVRLDNNQPVLVDNDTANGTRVNGKLVTSIKCLLNGDIISIGEYAWIFTSDLLKNRKKQSEGKIQVLLSKPIYKILIGLLFTLLLLSFLFPDKNKPLIETLLVTANSYEQNGQYSRAVTVLKKVREFDPDDQEIISKINILNQKIEIHNEIRQIEYLLTPNTTYSLLKAEEELKKLEDKFKDQEISSLTIPIREKIKNQKFANEYYDLLSHGNYQELIDRLSEFQHPEKAAFLLKARKGLARQLELSGQYQPASQEWQKVLEIENDEEAKQALAQIAAFESQPVQKSSKKSENKPPVVTGIFTKKYEITGNEQATFSIKTKDVDNDLLTTKQNQEAEQLYWTAYRKMQYKNVQAHNEALAMFEKVLKMTPDEKGELFLKTKEKIEQIKKELTYFCRDSVLIHRDLKF